MTANSETPVESAANPLCTDQWLESLQHVRLKASRSRPIVEGRLSGISGLTLEAVGCIAGIGDICHVEVSDGSWAEAQVIGFRDSVLKLMAIDESSGLSPGARVIPQYRQSVVRVGMELLGRVIDGSGNPLDEKGPVYCTQSRPIDAAAINPMVRAPITEPLDVGVRAINSLLTLGRGQRVGLFAGSGVGKSVLLGMIARGTQADVTVVCLLGERGREVGEFVSQVLGPEGLRTSVVIAIPADSTPLRRVAGASVATTIAEFFRDQGLDVLLMIDSLTRYAQAQREVGLAAGELPVSRGYPPSVFTGLPQLLERCGRTANGSITAIHTVLLETDEQDDPIGDAARAILDGHIVLSRPLAESGHFPAIDILASTSRLRDAVISPKQRRVVYHFVQHYSHYQQNRDLLSVGMYQAGSDPLLDKAVEAWPVMQAFLQQHAGECTGFERAMAELEEQFSVLGSQ